MIHSRHFENNIPDDVKEEIKHLVSQINSENIDSDHKKKLQKELNNIFSKFNDRWNIPKENHQFGQSCKNK